MMVETHQVMEPDCWSLPKLTTLVLTCFDYLRLELPLSYLTCLPSLTTLCLDSCKLPESFSLPSLTTLCVAFCILPQKVWNLPALLTLELDNVIVSNNISDYFLALPSLMTLALDFSRISITPCVISSSQLVNLEIRTSMDTSHEVNIVVLAPKLCNFKAIGIFWMAFEGSKLENVDIKVWDVSTFKKKYHNLFVNLFSQVARAKSLTLDLLTIQALSEISDILVNLSCPFYNLKYLKLPHGCEESSISSSVRHYLLGGSPSATIVKTLSRGMK